MTIPLRSTAGLKLQARTQCTFSRTTQRFQLFNLTFLQLETTKTAKYLLKYCVIKSSLRGSCRRVPGDGRLPADPIRPRWSPISMTRRHFMASRAFNLRHERERWPKIAFVDVKDYHRTLAGPIAFPLGSGWDQATHHTDHHGK